jgi:hypothetical protein
MTVFCCGTLPAQDAAAPTEREARAAKATEQRLAYAASAAYNPYEMDSQKFRKSADDFLAKEEFTQAIAEAKKGLAVAPYSIDLLIILASAYRAAGDIPNADQTREQWMSLVDSVLQSGTGKDFATAFQVISVDEEYAVLRILKFEVVGQTLNAHGGSEFDAMQVKDPRSGNELTLYFNIDLPKQWLTRQFSAAK